MASQSSFKTTPPTNRNLIINGDMNVNQRFGNMYATTFQYSPTAIRGSEVRGKTYIADRWYLINFQSSTALGTLQCNTVFDAPSALAPLTKSLQIITQTAKTSIGQTDQFSIGHDIESQNCNILKYGTPSALSATLSFWVKSSLIGTYSVSFRAYHPRLTFDLGGKYITQYTINSPNTWEYKTVIIPGATTFFTGSGNQQGLQIYFPLAAGTSTQTTLSNQWFTDTSLGLSRAHTLPTQTNFVGTLSSRFNITGVQFEVGSKATEFEYVPYAIELEACRRYFQKPMLHWTTGLTNNVSTSFPTVMRDRPVVQCSVNPTTITPSSLYFQSVGTYTLSALDADFY